MIFTPMEFIHELIHQERMYFQSLIDEQEKTNKYWKNETLKVERAIEQLKTFEKEGRSA